MSTYTGTAAASPWCWADKFKKKIEKNQYPSIRTKEKKVTFVLQFRSSFDFTYLLDRNCWADRNKKKL